MLCVVNKGSQGDSAYDLLQLPIFFRLTLWTN